MEQSTNWELEITVDDIFSLEGGRTVFVGQVTRGPDIVSECDCEIYLGDTPVTKVRIEGEMLPLNKGQKNLRAVSTVDKVDLNLIRAFAGKRRLVKVGF